MCTKQKSLIIGAAGFVGGYLIEQLESNCSVSVTKLPHETVSGNTENIEVYNLDIMNISNIKDLLNQVRPDHIYHLAAQSSVALSWKNPNLTVDINIKGTINLLDAVRELDYNPRVLLIGSGEEYGRIRPEETPVKEDNKLRPGNIYAVTKATQNMIGELYADAYGMDIVMVRAFNHIGPKQAPIFVVADFCRQVAEIEFGKQEPVIGVGNLSAKRDFTDVRDVVRAYEMLMENAKSGQIYNVGSGSAVEIRDILDMILSMSDKKIEVFIDESKLRPVDVPVIEADIRKITEYIGWKKEITLEQTIKETLDYWRNKKE